MMARASASLIFDAAYAEAVKVWHASIYEAAGPEKDFLKMYISCEKTEVKG